MMEQKTRNTNMMKYGAKHQETEVSRVFEWGGQFGLITNDGPKALSVSFTRSREIERVVECGCN